VFIGPRIPQGKGKVERMFQKLYGRVRSMLNDTGIKDEMIRGIWADLYLRQHSTTIFWSMVSLEN
jgi:hypothetical protein